MSLTTIVASIAAAAAVAGGVAAGAAILTTSGPFTDSDSDSPAASETATETSTITETATETSTITETPTAVDATPATEPSATTTPELVLDEGGWPIVECPDGSDLFRFEDRRISVCAPGEWSDRYWLEYRDGLDPRFVASTVVMQSPQSGLPALQVTLIERSSGPADHFRSPCERADPIDFLGVSGRLCIGTQEQMNGLPLSGAEGWMIEAFAETDSHYVKVTAAGAERDADAIRELRQIVLSNLGASAQNGLEAVR